MKKWLFSIIVLGFLLRIWGITFMPPWGDETNYIETSLRIGYGKFDPGLHHGGFLFYFLFSVFGSIYVLGKICGVFTSTIDILRFYITNPLPFFVIGRLTTILAGIAGIYFTFLLGKKLHSIKAGLFASLFLAVSPAVVQSCHYIKADIWVCLFVLISALFAVCILNNDRSIKYYLLSGLFAGLASATKIYGAVSILLLISVHFIAKNYNVKYCIKDKRIWFAFLFLLFGVTLGQPYIWSNLRELIPFMLGLKNTRLAEAGHMYGSDKWFYFFTIHLRNGIGLGLSLFCCVSILFYIIKFKKFLKLLIFIIPFLVIGIILIATSFFLIFYWIWLLPFLFILCGIFLSELMAAAINKKIKFLIVFFGILLALPPLMDSIRLDTLYSSKDTRFLSKKWIEDNIDIDTVLLTEGTFAGRLFYAPQLNPSIAVIDSERQKIQDGGGSGILYDIAKEQAMKKPSKKRYHILKTRFLKTNMITQDIDYVITSSEAEFYRHKKLKDYTVNTILGRDFEQIKEFIPFPLSRAEPATFDFNELHRISFYNYKKVVAGPTIRIYKRKYEINDQTEQLDINH